jgi:mRNA-degrading endonuclease RelE of RelBE toxin-antitoxin system
MSNRLEVTDHFKKKARNLAKKPRKKIASFIDIFQTGGFYAIDNVSIDGRIVRNKQSNNIPTSDPDFIKKVSFAQKHKLWHFHAGFYDVDCDIDGYKYSESGDLTSQWVIHYQKFSESHINIVDVTPHPPFSLPDEKLLTNTEE